MDIREFLAARLADDERIALAAAGKYTSAQVWTRIEPDRNPGLIGDGKGDVVTYGFGPGGPCGDQAEHIQRHDPAHVLRDVAAKRRILEMWEDPADVEHLPDGAVDGRDPDERDEQIATATVIDGIVRDLATVYAEHADYRQEWTP